MDFCPIAVVKLPIVKPKASRWALELDDTVFPIRIAFGDCGFPQLRIRDCDGQSNLKSSSTIPLVAHLVDPLNIKN